MKKVLWLSDFCKLKTGFGRNSKTVLTYLYDTGKYEIIEYVCAPFLFEDARLKSVPWKIYGSLPNDPYLRSSAENDPVIGPLVKYGGYYIDDIIEKEKPDIFIGVNDFWAFTGYYDKPWWNKIPSALWVTADSLPLWPDAIENGHKIKNFWVWSKFAEKELKGLGFDQVKTVHGAFDVSKFYPLNKGEVKSKFGLGEDFIFGFVFRNQIRKLVGTLLEAFAEFRKKNKCKLLLHTSWNEGWDIKSFIDEFKINNEDILTTHVCRVCKKVTIKPFEGSESDCQKCGSKKGLITPNVGFGVSEEEMNEIYNAMDYYIHPITSGGLEMPLVESLLSGTPISTINYSCGEEFCENKFVKTIKHNFYREFGTQFKKSQPEVNSIIEIMDYALNNNLEKDSKEGREWALKNFDKNTICKGIEEWIDSQPEANHNYDLKNKKYNNKAEFNDAEIDDEEWAKDLIMSVFGYDESSRNNVVKKILENLKSGESRRHIYEKAISAATRNNVFYEETAISKFFKEETTNNVCVVLPESLEERLGLLDFIKTLCDSEDNIYIVGEKGCGEVFAECGRFTTLPKSENTTNLSWLKNITNIDGGKRIKTIFYKSGGILKKDDNS